MILFEILLSFFGGASAMTPFLNQADDVQEFLFDIREARRLADGFLEAPHSVNNTIIAASGLSDYEALPKRGVCLNSGLHQVWTSKHDLQSERDEPIVVYRHIIFSSREGPTLNQFLFLTYSARTSLRSTDTDDPLLLPLQIYSLSIFQLPTIFFVHAAALVLPFSIPLHI